MIAKGIKMKTTIFVIVCVFGGVVSALLSNIGVFDIFAPVAEIEKEPNYSMSTYLSFVSVMMTAVTAVLATLAVAIAIVAWFTFREIKVIATSKATEIATSQATEIAIKEVNNVLNPRSISKLFYKSILDINKEIEIDDTQDHDSQN